jgi:hypothetical protein
MMTGFFGLLLFSGNNLQSLESVIVDLLSVFPDFYEQRITIVKIGRCKRQCFFFFGSDENIIHLTVMQ